jgi:hypothetical protein
LNIGRALQFLHLDSGGCHAKTILSYFTGFSVMIENLAGNPVLNASTNTGEEMLFPHHPH